MPQLAALLPGQKLPIALQLVMLPASAGDITPATPAKEVLEFPKELCGVRKGQKDARFDYVLTGLTLKRLTPVRESWWLRGVSFRDY
jgi:hypothetical protein